jgi:hypothetical protein
MASEKQQRAAKKNIKKAAKAAKKKRTVANLPANVRTALGKEGAKAQSVRRNERKSHSWIPNSALRVCALIPIPHSAIPH